jgi:hypothetical protein
MTNRIGSEEKKPRYVSWVLVAVETEDLLPSVDRSYFGACGDVLICIIYLYWHQLGDEVKSLQNSSSLMILKYVIWSVGCIVVGLGGSNLRRTEEKQSATRQGNF